MSPSEALSQIQRLVHQKTSRTEPALHHFQRDFDAIRAICTRVIGPFARDTENGATP